MRVLSVGCGKMGGAMVSRWVGLTGHAVTVVDPAMPQVAEGIHLVQDASSLQSHEFDLVMLALKPQLVSDVALSYRPFVAPGGCILSIAAGLSLSALEEVLPDHPIIRVMPNLPAQIGRGVTGAIGNGRVQDKHVEVVTRLMAEVGDLFWVQSEDELDRVTAVAGSGPGYVFEIARQYTEAAKALGFDEKSALTMVLGSIAGSIQLALESDLTLEELRDNVTSAKGTTEAGLRALRRDDILQKLFSETLEAAYQRAVALRTG